MRSAALCRWQQAENQFESIAQASGVSQRGGRLASLVREVLQESGEKPESVDRIVVGVGPGSTAGIRSTLAFALGWSVALGTPAVGISSVWALASRAREKQLFGQVTCLIRGTVGRIYRSSFQISLQRIAQTRPLERIHPDQLCSIANDCHCIVGPEAPEILSAFPSNKKESSFLAASVFPERLLPLQVPSHGWRMKTINISPNLWNRCIWNLLTLSKPHLPKRFPSGKNLRIPLRKRK